MAMVTGCQWDGATLALKSQQPVMIGGNRRHSVKRPKMISNFPAVLNFNRLFLKRNRFICKWLPILPDHSF